MSPCSLGITLLFISLTSDCIVQNTVTDSWNWVMSWVDMIPHSSLVTLLEKHFFPRWLQVLGTWLSGPDPNYYEVTSWYQGWKALFPQQLLSDSTVKGISS